jgi:hypothetical protein
MPELEQELRELGVALAWPETPDFSARVRHQLERAPAPARRRRLGRGRALVLAFAVLLIGASAVLAASPDARDAVRRWFAGSLTGVVVQRVPVLPTLPPVAEQQPLLLMPRRSDVAEAAKVLHFRPLVPAALGDPDRVYADDDYNGGVLQLLYRPHGTLPRSPRTGVGALITELQGFVTKGPPLGKLAAPGTIVEQLRIDGHRAMWIAGDSHVVVFDSKLHNTQYEERRLAGNVLLVERPGGVLVRIEADVSRARAIRIARSLETR